MPAVIIVGRLQPSGPAPAARGSGLCPAVRACRLPHRGRRSAPSGLESTRDRSRCAGLRPKRPAAPMERKLNRRRPLRAKERAGRACSTTPLSEVPAGSIRLPFGLQKGFTSTAETGSPFLEVAELMPAVSRACMVPEVRSTASAGGNGRQMPTQGAAAAARGARHRIASRPRRAAGDMAAGCREAASPSRPCADCESCRAPAGSARGSSPSLGS